MRANDFSDLPTPQIFTFCDQKHWPRSASKKQFTCFKMIPVLSRCWNPTLCYPNPLILCMAYLHCVCFPLSNHIGAMNCWGFSLLMFMYLLSYLIMVPKQED